MELRLVVAVVFAAAVLLPTRSSTFAQGICFSPATVMTATSNPRAVAASDLDGDGDLDLAVANSQGDNVSIWSNDGNGIMASPVYYSAGDFAVSVSATDLDGDGDPDLALGVVGGVRVLTNNGDGTFAGAVEYTTGSLAMSVFATDLDGDGDRDLAAANWGSNNVSVLLNNGDATFTTAVNYATGLLAGEVAAADLDGDGDQDLAVANRDGGNISILKNNGDASFAATINYPMNAGSLPLGLFPADVDGDGDPDLAVASEGNNGNVSIMSNDGNGSFTAPVDYAAGGAECVIAADLDGDGDLDLAVTNGAGHNISIRANTGAGLYAPAKNYAAEFRSTSIVAGDLDGDGDLDLAVANYGDANSFPPDPGDVSTYLNGSHPDGDNDGIGDACDNCPSTYNPGQEDTDHNGVGEVCQFSADLSATPTWGGKPLAVTFTDQSLGSPTGWSWNFGDGSPLSTQQNPPPHTYANAGWYDVSLTITKAALSSTRRILRYIHVDDVPTPDLSVTVYGNPQPRPGFDKTYVLQVLNLGTDISTATSLHYDIPPPATYVSSVPLGSEAGGTVSWPVPPVTPATSGSSYTVTVNVPPGTSLGTILSATALVDASGAEVQLLNNTGVDDETVVASIDPNDLVVQPTGCGPGHDRIQGTSPLTFTIHFENQPTATADAIYVLVLDTLDNDLDWGTLQIGPTSKDAVAKVDFNPITGEVRWYFYGIHLPPNVTPPEGEGFVTYTVSPKPGLPIGAVISSRGHIRFDFNDWITAPHTGVLDLALLPCDCDCPYQGNINADLAIDVFDVIGTIGIAFSGEVDPQDSTCPISRGDVDNNAVTDVFDVIFLIATAFSGGPNPIDPCAL